MFDDEHGDFHVVVNDEEQYSIWPAGRDVPAGWRPVGPPGPKADRLAFIDRTWTDLRPLSLRRQAAARREEA
ncbi:MbtH family protein [Actinomadura sp. ATCC 31491]|uniref:MbtH family protein n=1 Tax=Actinomadura luzonensis TaxID=2805427 RepID=A0ABT0FSX0_9ACTN|nr:MbtH family protein [Actinomadura luzonensis]MCK2215439.1 MbtH family protein [Actinomadura luzonensis]